MWRFWFQPREKKNRPQPEEYSVAFGARASAGRPNTPGTDTVEWDFNPPEDANVTGTGTVEWNFDDDGFVGDAGPGSLELSDLSSPGGRQREWSLAESED